MSLRFFTWPRSSGSGTHWALEELGVPYELLRLDRQKNENRTPAYLAVSPAGKVPAIVDNGQAYFESLAILLHLGEAYGCDVALWPATGPARAEALCWSVWGTTELHAYTMQFLYHGLDTPVSYAPDQRSKATADYNHSQLLRLLDVLDERLGAREHILGAFSLADIPAAQALMFGTALGLSLEGRANVERWLERCRARPALARVSG